MIHKTDHKTAALARQAYPNAMILRPNGEGYIAFDWPSDAIYHPTTNTKAAQEYLRVTGRGR